MRKLLVGFAMVLTVGCSGGQVQSTDTIFRTAAERDRAACERLTLFATDETLDENPSKNQLNDGLRALWDVAKDADDLNIRGGARLMLAWTEDVDDAESFATGLGMMMDACGFMPD